MAEDLGVITYDVVALRRASDWVGRCLGSAAGGWVGCWKGSLGGRGGAQVDSQLAEVSVLIGERCLGLITSDVVALLWGCSELLLGRWTGRGGTQAGLG